MEKSQPVNGYDESEDKEAQHIPGTYRKIFFLDEQIQEYNAHGDGDSCKNKRKRLQRDQFSQYSRKSPYKYNYMEMQLVF